MASEQPAVLVVEDDPAIQEVLSDMLSIGGFTVETADDGRQAIAALARHRPPAGGLRLMLLDMMLPEVDGAGVLEYLAELGNYVPVIAMSASRQHLDVARTAGVQTVLAKPFELREILALVQQYSEPAPDQE